MDPDKIECVKTWPVPTSVKEVRSFLGFVGFYRKFIPSFAEVARPLYDCLLGQPVKKRKGKFRSEEQPLLPWVWSDAQQMSFEALRQHMISEPVLMLPQIGEEFEMHIDASGHGLGAVLLQKGPDGKSHPVAYASRSLRGGERMYPPMKLEFKSLFWSVTQAFKNLLTGAPNIKVQTDSNPLTYVLSTLTLDATTQRWVNALASYNFEISYKRGVTNTDADALSRLPVKTVPAEKVRKVFQEVASRGFSGNSECDNAEEFDVFQLYTQPLVVPGINAPILINPVMLDPDVADPEIGRSPTVGPFDWPKLHASDPVIREVMAWKAKGHRPTVRELKLLASPVRQLLKEWNRLLVQDGILYREVDTPFEGNLQLVVPWFQEHNLTKVFLEECHEHFGHQRRDRTFSLIAERFFWPGYYQDVARHCRACHRCIIANASTAIRAAPLQPIVTSEPWELLTIDHVTIEQPGSGTGERKVLTVVDHFSKYTFAFVVPNEKAATTARVLYEKIFVHYGFPRRLHSDNGPGFTSELMAELKELCGIDASFTSPYHPEGNGLTERSNQTIQRMLRVLESEKKSSWPKHLSTLMFFYNSTRHASTHCIPYEVVFGRAPYCPVDALLPDSGQRIVPTAVYVKDIQARLQYTYDLVKRHTEAAAGRQAHYYNSKVKGKALLRDGDFVLVKILHHTGKHKITDKFEDKVYVIVDRADEDTSPSYLVRPVDGPVSAPHRRVHRNHLLPLLQEEPETVVPPAEFQDDISVSAASERSQSQSSHLSSSSSGTVVQQEFPPPVPGVDAPEDEAAPDEVSIGDADVPGEEPEVDDISSDSIAVQQEDDFMSASAGSDREDPEDPEEEPPPSPEVARRYPVRERRKPKRLIEEIGVIGADEAVDRPHYVWEWLTRL